MSRLYGQISMYMTGSSSYFRDGNQISIACTYFDDLYQLPVNVFVDRQIK